MLITDKKSEMKFNIANDMAIKALEKQISHKPITYKGTNRADCPICGNTVRGINKPFGDWCNKCGAKLDWSGK
jgi:anaerobic ribonucleoside-triphosphate reductase